MFIEKILSDNFEFLNNELNVNNHFEKNSLISLKLGKQLNKIQSMYDFSKKEEFEEFLELSYKCISKIKDKNFNNVTYTRLVLILITNIIRDNKGKGNEFIRKCFEYADIIDKYNDFITFSIFDYLSGRTSFRQKIKSYGKKIVKNTDIFNTNYVNPLGSTTISSLFNELIDKNIKVYVDFTLEGSNYKSTLLLYHLNNENLEVVIDIYKILLVEKSKLFTGRITDMYNFSSKVNELFMFTKFFKSLSNSVTDDYKWYLLETEIGLKLFEEKFLYNFNQRIYSSDKDYSLTGFHHFLNKLSCNEIECFKNLIENNRKFIDCDDENYNKLVKYVNKKYLEKFI